MRISAAGSRSGPLARSRARGFTLIELMLVVAIIAIATAVASLALRDPTAAKLEQEAARLAALLESARAEARSSGVPARWEPLEKQPDGNDFRFVGLSANEPLPTHWLEPGTAAQVIGARAVVLGPEPLIGEQRIVLRLDDHRLTLTTDGIGPFLVGDGGPAAQ
ncbi:MAG: prepilin-type N-terminal cleavage/methylation domain-containing protein [Burkholderiales bacterium]|nr:prepilin-type N-terminal cleavage/methylation domain-containing protein [Burkholderiales bacterium]